MKEPCIGRTLWSLTKSNKKLQDHVRSINYVRKMIINLMFSKGTKTNKDSIIIVGNLNRTYVNSHEISHSLTVKFHPNSIVTSCDLIDYVKLLVRKKLYTLVVHIGSNDIQKGIKTMKMITKLAREIKEINSKNRELK